MTDTELLPCPFCGGTAKLYEQASHTDEMHDAWIQCTTCHIETDVASDFEPYMARVPVVRKWNKRDWSAAMDLGKDDWMNIHLENERALLRTNERFRMQLQSEYGAQYDKLLDRLYEIRKEFYETVVVPSLDKRVIPDDGNVVQD